MDAKQLGALTPRSFGGPSNDKEPVNTGKRTPEWRKRIGQTLKRRWANMTAAERQAEIDRKHATERRRWALSGAPKLSRSFIPSWVDEDFEELGF